MYFILQFKACSANPFLMVNKIHHIHVQHYFGLLKQWRNKLYRRSVLPVLREDINFEKLNDGRLLTQHLQNDHLCPSSRNCRLAVQSKIIYNKVKLFIAKGHHLVPVCWQLRFFCSLRLSANSKISSQILMLVYDCPLWWLSTIYTRCLNLTYYALCKISITRLSRCKYCQDD